MANTTNFGWETPDDTDLVKDGAAAMRTLGNAIDASLVDLKGGTTGQVLSKNTNTDMDFTWVTPNDADAIQNSIVDAKGDLISASAADTPARLASSGVNGDVLTVDTSTATGLKWAAPAAGGDTFAAGKNKIINGDFRINQRAFSSTTTDATYGFDRWLLQSSGGATYSAQTFTPGTAPVAGYEGINFARIATTGQSGAGVYTTLGQRIESVRSFANRTVTVSFWAKASSGTPSVAVELVQNFGTGGSPSSVTQTFVTKQQITTSWARYSASVAVPSISGKTLGTNNDGYLELDLWTSAGTNFNARTSTLGIQTATIDFWGVQVEAGSSATDFQTATGTFAGELAACQRYYYLMISGNARSVGTFAYYLSNQVYGTVSFPVTMRTAPTLVASTGTDYYTIAVNGGNDLLNSFTGDVFSNNSAWLYNTTEASSTTGFAGVGRSANAAASIAFSAEL